MFRRSEVAPVSVHMIIGEFHHIRQSQPTKTGTGSMLLRSLFPLILTMAITGELEMDQLQLRADGGGVLVRKSQLSATRAAAA